MRGWQPAVCRRLLWDAERQALGVAASACNTRETSIIVPRPPHVLPGHRRLGFNVFISALAVPVIHGTFAYWSGPSWIPDPLFRIYVGAAGKPGVMARGCGQQQPRIMVAPCRCCQPALLRPFFGCRSRMPTSEFAHPATGFGRLGPTRIEQNLQRLPLTCPTWSPTGPSTAATRRHLTQRGALCRRR